jgi:pimeloyl-ACP methyl ester carboxylesterase
LNVIGSSGAVEPRNQKAAASAGKSADPAPVLEISTIEARIRGVIQNDAFLTQKKLEEYYDMANREGRAQEAAARSKLILPEENLAYARPIIAKISSPTLIIWGLNNPAFSPGAADDIVGLISASVMTRKAIYDNVGHKVEEENPRQVASDTRHFLEDVGFWKAD